MCSCESEFSLQIKVGVCLILKNINQCLQKHYLEYVSVGLHNNMNDDGDPSTKISRHTLNTYNIGPLRPRGQLATEYINTLNIEKNQNKL